MLISVIAGLVTAFSIYQGCHSLDTAIQAKKAAKETANDIADTIGDIFDDDDDDIIVENPIIVDPIADNDINNDDGHPINDNDDGEQPSAQQPRNEKGQFTKK